MSNDLSLRRKWTLKAHDKQVIFIKKRNESERHVLMKACLWALYLPTYADLLIEVNIAGRYKPDLVMLDVWQKPLFWGEAGEVGQRKIRKMVRKHRQTHFAMAKWGTQIDPYVALVQRELKRVKRTAPFDILGIGRDSAEKFITPSGHINISFEDVTFIRLDP